jgi:hypothetical protein
VALSDTSRSFWPAMHGSLVKSAGCSSKSGSGPGSGRAFRAQREGGHHLAGHEVLAPVGHRAALDQAQQAVADHLAVHAQVALALQLGHHRVRDAADADLQRVAVLDQRGHVAGDGLLHRPDLRGAG